ncbi:MAG: tRNA lysidine(34) synthetase TilS, partial [Deltaproteobacteria bacterium]|nr:tRNA lysidine(34) synthetase TilS [Deltaproteobacteria bacterium]
LGRGDKVLVALSGGADSVCLLDVLVQLKDELGIQLVAAHFDHGLRPGQDEDETRFAASLADSFSLPFVSEKANQDFRKLGGSLEEKARDARYRFLEGARERFSAQKIALGHTLNDQAETVLMRLLRGSGPSGLAGIPPKRDDTIIRPLIDVTRSEIETYLNQKELTYVTDPTNVEERHLRNRIRLDLLPHLETYQPRIVELLGRTARIMRSDEAWLKSRADASAQKVMERGENGEIGILLNAFVKLPDALRNRVVRQALEITGGGLRRVSLGHIEAINRMAGGTRPQARIDLPWGMVVKKVYDRLVFTKVKERGYEALSYTLKGSGEYTLEGFGRAVALEEIDKDLFQKRGTSQWQAFFDADRLAFPLVIRNIRAGDRFVPLGMKGRKKVKDLFIDLKIPSEKRALIPLLVCRDMIVWVCGLRMDDRFKVIPQTKRVLKITFREIGGA